MATKKREENRRKHRGSEEVSRSRIDDTKVQSRVKTHENRRLYTHTYDTAGFGCLFAWLSC